MFIGIGLPITQRFGGGASSSAALALLNEWGPDGLAFDFTDDFYEASTGFYGSAAIIDTGTPANNYDSSPTLAASSKLTANVTAKFCLGPDGTYRYQAHNLYLNSASPANQSITVVSGATYAITITGSVSVAVSGAATGTWTAGTTTFTAATTTLTLGSTSGSGTVHVRRTPSDDTYLATGALARFDLPYTWDTDGNLEGILVEEERTNLCLRSNDLSSAAWTKLNSTATKTATGPDGVTNSASVLTCTANYGYARQPFTVTSAARSFSAFIKRRTGTGNVYISQGAETGSTIVTDGGFPSGSIGTSWTNISTGGGTASDATNALVIDSAGGAARGQVTQALTTTAGKLYRVTFSRTLNSGADGFVSIGTTSGGSDLRFVASSSTHIFFVAAGTTTHLTFTIGFGGAGNLTIDNVVVKECTRLDVSSLINGTTYTQCKIENETITNPEIWVWFGTANDAVDIAYAQMETGAFCTSPIETYGSSSTRVADNTNNATTTAPSIATAGTRIIHARTAAGSGTQVLGTIDDGTANERYRIERNSSNEIRFIVTDGGVEQANLNLGTVANNTEFKVAVAWSANDIAGCLNGGTVQTDGAATLPTVTTQRYGSSSTGQQWGGVIISDVLLPTRKSNANLQALST